MDPNEHAATIDQRVTEDLAIKWTVECDCGYKSREFDTLDMATEAAEEHEAEMKESA